MNDFLKKKKKISSLQDLLELSCCGSLVKGILYASFFKVIGTENLKHIKGSVVYRRKNVP